MRQKYYKGTVHVPMLLARFSQELNQILLPDRRQGVRAMHSKMQAAGWLLLITKLHKIKRLST